MRARISRVVAAGFLFLTASGATEANAQTSAQIVRRVADEVWNRGDLAAVEALFADDFVNHDPNPGGATDLEDYKRWIREWRAAFPDLHVEVHDLIAEGDRVGARYTVTGTHRGPLFGVPATGIRVTMKGINLYRLDRGKIAEVYRSYDLLGVGQQIGYFEPLPETVFPYSFARRSEPEDFVWGEPSPVTGAPGDPQFNKALCLREVEQGWNQGNAAAALELVAPTFVWHSIYPEVTDYESYGQWLEGHIDPETPTQITIEILIAEGDKVVDLSTADLGGGVRESAIRISRFADGRLVEMWRNINVLPLFIAMDLLPAFPQ
ncbi:MAG: ester cyclase [Gemmatimonadales bacterium]